MNFEAPKKKFQSKPSRIPRSSSLRIPGFPATSCLRAFTTQAIHFQNGRATHRNTELPIHPKSSRIFHENCAPACPRQRGHLWQLLTRFHRSPFLLALPTSEQRIGTQNCRFTENRHAFPTRAAHLPSLAAAARFRRSPFLLTVPTLEQRIRTQHCQFSRNRHAFSTRAAHRPALDIVAVFGSCRPIPRSSHKAGTWTRTGFSGHNTLRKQPMGSQRGATPGAKTQAMAETSARPPSPLDYIAMKLGCPPHVL